MEGKELSITDYKYLADIFRSIATALSFFVGGIWVYLRFIRQQEKYPNINFIADLNVIGLQNGFWIIELIALLENKGKAQHKFNKFKFDLNGLKAVDSIDVNDNFGGQVDFKHQIADGSFLPEQYDFFFIDPGTAAKYSHIVRVPEDISFLLYHAYFNYADRRGYRHAAEKTVQLKLSNSDISVETDANK